MSKISIRESFPFFRPLVVFGFLGGANVLKRFLSGFKDVLVAIFPTLLEFTIESYLSSPGFICGVVSFLCAAVGFYFTKKQKQCIFKPISSALAVISVFSFGKGLLY